MKTIRFFLISLFAGLVYLGIWLIWPVQEQPEANTPNTFTVRKPETDTNGQGYKLFKSNCASCHKLDNKLIGPALRGVEARWAATPDYQGISGRDWLKRFIRNWQDPVRAGHPYANKIIMFDGSAMTAFPQLTDAGIDSLLAYIQAGNQPVPLGVR